MPASSNKTLHAVRAESKARAMRNSLFPLLSCMTQRPPSSAFRFCPAVLQAAARSSAHAELVAPLLLCNPITCCPLPMTPNLVAQLLAGLTQRYLGEIRVGGGVAVG